MSDVDICDRTFKFALRIIKLCDWGRGAGQNGFY